MRFEPTTQSYAWVLTVGADSVSCPFSFNFLTCLIGAYTSIAANIPKEWTGVETEVFSSLKQKYLARDFCAHLAVMSRLYNDYGSIVRDRAEANANSVDFPEFDHLDTGSVATSDGLPESQEGRAEWQEEETAMLKAQLLDLAVYERKCVEHIQAELLKEVGKREDAPGREEDIKVRTIKLLTGVANLYADLYVAKDLSNLVAK